MNNKSIYIIQADLNPAPNGTASGTITIRPPLKPFYLRSLLWDWRVQNAATYTNYYNSTLTSVSIIISSTFLTDMPAKAVTSMTGFFNGDSGFTLYLRKPQQLKFDSPFIFSKGMNIVVECDNSFNPVGVVLNSSLAVEIEELE